MAKINSRTEFINYCMRSLGAPVMRINVDIEQVEDRIDDALDLFWEFHHDGSEVAFLSIPVTQEMVDNQYISLPPETQSVLSVIHGGVGNGKSGIANTNLQYQAYITDVMNPQKIMRGDLGLGNYYITQSYYSLLADTFGAESRIEFNHHYDKLRILSDWKNIIVGDYILVECHRKIMPEISGDVWNNRWLKRYAVALIKKQWGTNLIKFVNVSLPGGAQINGQEIMTEAMQEIETLKQELMDLYHEPNDFFMG